MSKKRSRALREIRSEIDYSWDYAPAPVERWALDHMARAIRDFLEGEWTADGGGALEWFPTRWVDVSPLAIAPKDWRRAFLRAVENRLPANGVMSAAEGLPELEQMMRNIAAWKAAVLAVEAAGNKALRALAEARG